VGEAYSETLAASGGTAPRTWSINSGSLPAGLMLSVTGEITGTPTTAGTSTFTALVTDAVGATASKTLTIEVAGADEDEDGESEKAEKVTVCHMPPGNPDNAHTISVGAPALEAHLGHGDTEGECAGVAPASSQGEENGNNKGKGNDKEKQPNPGRGRGPR
jgi:hypothetical protein